MKIKIPGKPVPKGRPRIGRNGVAYTPKKTSDFEQLVRDVFGLQVSDPPIQGPVICKMDFYFKIPKSYTKKRKRKICQGLERKTTKPDLDNLIKSIADGLNGLAYKDDSQIIQIQAEKHYTTGDSYTEITLEEAETG